MRIFPAIAVATAYAALWLGLKGAPRPVVRAAARPQTDGAPRSDGAVASDRTPTWSHDIAGILYHNCTACHHPGGAGPFSLLTYAEARRWGPQLAVVTQSRFMPPWLPEPGYGNFADVRRLGDRERALIKQWVADKMPEGDAATAPAAPHYEGSWVLGKPNLVLKFPRSLTVPAGGTDVFWNFILPYPLAQSHYIRAMEIRPGSPQVVHHANIAIDRLASMRHKLGDRWQDGVGGMNLYIDAGNSFDPDSHFLFWKPDTPALIEPEDMPWRLDPGNDLILNMHLKPSGKPETMDGEVGLYFASKPPTKQPMLVSLDRDDALDIPAGDAHFVVEDSLALPVDVEALGVYPHAHYLGHDLRGGPFCRRVKRNGWFGFATGISIASRSTAIRNLCTWPRARCCTCAIHTTTRQPTRTILMYRRYACAQETGLRMRWLNCGCNCCQCTRRQTGPIRACRSRRFGCAIACARRPAMRFASTTLPLPWQGKEIR